MPTPPQTDTWRTLVRCDSCGMTTAIRASMPVRYGDPADGALKADMHLSCGHKATVITSERNLRAIHS